jgi:hypothetical protein
MVVSRVRCAIVSLACLGAACTSAGAREEAFVREQIAALPGVETVQVACGSGWLSARGDVCVSVKLSEGVVLGFAGVGYDSFGAAPSGVRVTLAGGRSPLVVSCASRSAAAAIDRAGLFGHHFTPAIEAVPEAIKRRREVIEELEFWPQCPQFWEVADGEGTAYRYCAHATPATAEPPPPPCDQSLDKTR